mmetsp:Transcript_72068/g.113857  ORF Transcript_72068/g.113857 Transcript_72068/m.113857 type:complete len:250 (+) Transcript_72068:89-838(+)
MGAFCTSEDKAVLCRSVRCCETESIEIPAPLVESTIDAETPDAEDSKKQVQDLDPIACLPEDVKRQVTPKISSPNGAALEVTPLTNGVHHVLSIPAADDRPNFTGKWKCYASRGDWDSFLSARGINFVQRKAFKALGYGVNTCRHIIEQVGDRFKLISVTAGLKVANDIRLGGEEQEWTDGVVGIIFTSPLWDGTTLVMNFKKKERKEGVKVPFYTASHYLEDGNMVVKSHVPNGAPPVFLYFSREMGA